MSAAPVPPPRRTLLVSEDLVRRYSRRGNFHSEHSTAEQLGLPGLVAQGTQVTGPAYGLLLDEWGEEFLAYGELDVKFVGMTVAGETVTAELGAPPDGERTAHAIILVTNDDRGAIVVAGDAHRTARST
jgi:acyl dehydratase